MELIDRIIDPILANPILIAIVLLILRREIADFVRKMLRLKPKNGNGQYLCKPDFEKFVAGHDEVHKQISNDIGELKTMVKQLATDMAVVKHQVEKK